MPLKIKYKSLPRGIYGIIHYREDESTVVTMASWLREPAYRWSVDLVILRLRSLQYKVSQNPQNDWITTLNIQTGPTVNLKEIDYWNLAYGAASRPRLPAPDENRFIEVDITTSTGLHDFRVVG